MAVTKVWGIKGSVFTVTKYTANKAKTWNEDYNAAARFHQHDTPVETVMDYTADQMKTEKQLYVTGINCSDDPQVAARQFYDTKDAFNKNDSGNPNRFVCMHAYQSFKPGEVTPELCHKISVELARRVWGDKFEVLVSSHLNTNACHSHFVCNNISFVDGSRYLDNKATYRRFREESDKLCREYGLSVIEHPTYEHSQREGGIIKADVNKQPTILSTIKQDIDLAIAVTPRNFNEFIDLMEQFGYRLERRGKDLRIIPNAGKGKPRRLRTLGEGYTEYDLKERIEMQYYSPMDYHYREYKPTFRVPNTLYGLYVHYCYLLGIFPKSFPVSREARAVLREDKIKAQKYSDEANMLGKYHIHTDADLKVHYDNVSDELAKKQATRKTLRDSLRRMPEGEEKEKTKERIKALSKDIKQLYREQELCKDVAFRSAGIEAVVKLIELPPPRQQEQQRSRYGKDER